jgi:hypothetical protein
MRLSNVADGEIDMGILLRALAVIVLAVTPTLAAAQTAMQAKQCNTKFIACESKCQPLVKQVPGGQWKQNKEGAKCRSKCASARISCNAARPPAQPAAPACRVNTDCRAQPDGQPVLCVNGQCMAT